MSLFNFSNKGKRSKNGSQPNANDQFSENKDLTLSTNEEEVVLTFSMEQLKQEGGYNVLIKGKKEPVLVTAIHRKHKKDDLALSPQYRKYKHSNVVARVDPEEFKLVGILHPKYVISSELKQRPTQDKAPS